MQIDKTETQSHEAVSSEREETEKVPPRPLIN